MTTKTPAASPPSPRTDDLSATDIFQLLAAERRRYVLHYLSNKAGSVPLGELAEQLALWEETPTYDHYERILTSLHHRHLPKLTEAGMVRYDVEREAVSGRDAIEAVRPYLELAVADDLT